MSNKISIRFYKDHKVRAIWDEKQNQWWFSVLDIVGAINEQDNHEKNRNYWKYLKAKLKKEQSEVVSATTQLKLTAADGKRYYTDVISQEGVEKLAKSIRNQQAMDFLDWITYSDNSIDGQSRKKAYTRMTNRKTTMEYITHKNRIAAIDNGEEIGEVTFPERDGVYVINHTYVDDRYRGQGIASELVRRAVETIEQRGGKMEATCSYALLWLARNRGCEITSPLSCPIR